MRQRFAGRPVAVCLELAKGPLVYALQKYDFLVLFPVHPATLAKYREAFVPSHAKADPSDAQFALELLLRYRAKLKALTPQSVPLARCCGWSNGDADWWETKEPHQQSPD